MSFYRILGVVVVVGMMCATATSAWAETQNESGVLPVAESFPLGGGMTGDIDQRTGALGVTVPVAQLPGRDGGAVDLSLSYSQELAEAGTNRFGIGRGWVWASEIFVDVDGQIRVFTPSGEAFEADESQPSGLAHYTVDDLVFSQKQGVLPARPGVPADVSYAFSLTHDDGTVQYFNAHGDAVAHINKFGIRDDIRWDDAHRLTALVDAAGSQINIEWNESSLRVVAPVRNDGVVPCTVVEFSANELSHITNPVNEKTAFTYDEAGFLAHVVSPSDALTEITYPSFPDGRRRVGTLRIIDAVTRQQLFFREWNSVGEHTPSGWPVYADAQALWASGDGEYRFRTRVSDGSTHVISEYNAMGLMVARQFVTASSAGDVATEEHQYVYLGTESGGVPNPAALPKQYANPTQLRTIFRNKRGGERSISESMVSDERGRSREHVSVDGTRTTTVYDGEGPCAAHDVNSGRGMSFGLVCEQTVTGFDGTVSKTVNTLTPDRKAVAAEEKFVGPSLNEMVSQSRTEFTVESDGFVSEKRILSTSAVQGDALVTRYKKTVNDAEKTVSLYETNAVGTSAESTTVKRFDTTTGLVLSEIDATRRVTTSTYDAVGRLLTHTQPTGLTTFSEYGNRVTRTTDPKKVTRSEYVDALGQVVGITDNILHAVATPGFERVIEKREYAANFSEVKVTDGRGLTTVKHTDPFGRTTDVFTPTGIHQITEHDDVANTVTNGLVSANASGLSEALQISRQHRDNNNRVIATSGERSDGVAVPASETRFDGLGRVTETFADDVSTSLDLNPDGTARVSTVTPQKSDMFPGEQLTATREHDAQGTPTKKTLTRSSGEKRDGVSRVLNIVGHVISETDQMGRTTTYDYTVDGLVAHVFESATGIHTHNTYDSVTRALTLTEIVAADGTVSAKAYEYDPITSETVAIFDPHNKDATIIRYAYDIFGNQTQITYPDGKTIKHIFDDFGRKESTTDIAGATTVYEYDSVGRMSGATQRLGDTVLAQVAYGYDALSRVSQLSRGNGMVTDYTFTSADQIATEKTNQNGAVIFEAAYDYDTHGNLGTRTVTANMGEDMEGVPASSVSTETTTYTYNAYNQLLSSSVYAGAHISQSRELQRRTTYDIGVSGEITKETVSAGGESDAVSTVREFEYNSLGQTTAVITNGVKAEQSYDAAGNLLHSVDGTSYTYNVFDQPVLENRSDGSSLHTTYWVTGERQTVNESSDITTTYWDGGAILNESYGEASAAQDTASYLFGLSRNSRFLTHNAGNGSETRTNYYVTDRHGNVTATVDTAGSLTATYSYSDYGMLVNKAENSVRSDFHQNPFQYAGEYTDKTGKQYLASRVYDPHAFGFTTKDSAEQFNLYAYANANPITLIDPTGQNAAQDNISNGIYTSLLFTAALIGVILSIPVGGISWGFADFWTAIGCAGGDFLIMGTQIVNQHLYKFIPKNDGLSDGLMGLSAALSFIGIAAGVKGIKQLTSKIDRTLMAKEIDILNGKRTLRSEFNKKLKFRSGQEFEFDCLTMTNLTESKTVQLNVDQQHFYWGLNAMKRSGVDFSKELPVLNGDLTVALQNVFENNPKLQALENSRAELLRDNTRSRKLKYAASFLVSLGVIGGFATTFLYHDGTKTNGDTTDATGSGGASSREVLTSGF